MKRFGKYGRKVGWNSDTEEKYEWKIWKKSKLNRWKYMEIMEEK